MLCTQVIPRVCPQMYKPGAFRQLGWQDVTGVMISTCVGQQRRRSDVAGPRQKRMMRAGSPERRLRRAQGLGPALNFLNDFELQCSEGKKAVLKPQR
jgi:hypothetical protein